MDTKFITATTARTLPGLLEERIGCSPDALAYREYDNEKQTWIGVTWSEFGARVDAVTGALYTQGLSRGDRVGILLRNSIDWLAFDMAAQRLGLVVVPIYMHDSPANALHIIRDSEMRLLFVDTTERWDAIASCDPSLACVEYLWIRRPGTEQRETGSLLRIRSFAGVLTDAQPISTVDRKICPADTATLIYTSGTTGPAKGVMLSHAAILKNAEAVASVVAPRADDVFLSILPLAHGFERTLGYYLPMMGGATVVFSRSLFQFEKDLKVVGPTVLMAVPRLYEQIYDNIRSRVRDKPLQRMMLEATAKIGWRRAQWFRAQGPSPRLHEFIVWPLLKALVASSVSRALGGRLRVSVSGGASLAPDVARFLVGLGLPIVEGYGLSEAGPTVTGSTIEDYRPGSAGRLLPGIEAKVSADGELLVRSPSCMTGYWRNPSATCAVLDAAGWLATGDLAELRNNRVYITGRRKDIIVLSNGENINPIPIEQSILEDPLFNNVCIVGDGQRFLSAIVSLNADAWEQRSKSWELAGEDDGAEKLEDRVLDIIRDRLRELPSQQKVFAVHIDHSPWTIENGLLTPTLKVRRQVVLDRFRTVINQIYESRRPHNGRR